LKSIKDKKLRGNLKALENKYKDATLKAKDAEILLENSSGLLEPENELERTYKVRQDEIRQNVPVETAKKSFELNRDNTSREEGTCCDNGLARREAGLWITTGRDSAGRPMAA
jgi:U3 small nucleolar RNA-associated protein 7